MSRNKDNEEYDCLELFSREYKHHFDTDIEVIEKRESPDFLIKKEGKEFWIELVKVLIPPPSKFANEVFNMPNEIHIVDASDRIQREIYEKNKKRRRKYWDHSNNCILLVDLYDSDMEEIYDYWGDEIRMELRQTGFKEIWISDHRYEESHNTVSITCIKPKKWEGVYEHSQWGKKPYKY
jgi:hypothetical protein